MSMKLKKGQTIEIERENFTITEIAKHYHEEGETIKTYYSYSLSSENPDVTHAEIDDYHSGNFIFHITKKVKSNIENLDIHIGNNKYLIAKEKDEIFIDPLNGDLQDAKCYEVVGCKTGMVPSELHILPDGTEIFYLTMKLKKEDLKWN
jgi:hypothetical protein